MSSIWEGLGHLLKYKSAGVPCPKGAGKLC